MREFKIVDNMEMAETWFLHKVKRCWYVDNYLEDIPEAYTAWDTSSRPTRVKFKDIEKIIGDIGEGHPRKVIKYAKRILKGEKEMPPILVYIRANGRHTIRDGNCRASAIMRLQKEGKDTSDIIIPAYILDYREKPY